MNDFSRSLAVLLITALVPVSVSAQDLFGIEFGDVVLNAFSSVDTQLDPIQTATDTKSAPRGDTNSVEVLVSAPRGVPFPNLPNSVGTAFASSAGDNDGLFGVGVNGFFFMNSLPPNALLASGFYSETITNNSESTVSIFADVTIPAPTIQFFGVGDSFPSGVDPRRDALASVNASILTTITHPDGTIEEATPLDYGISVFRHPLTGVLSAIDADGALISRFEEPDGSFGFQLPNFQQENLELGEFGPGDILEFKFDYFASASTGFGETGIFAAIGDPFDLSASGGHFELQPVPEPALGALVAEGLVALLSRARGRAVPSKKSRSGN